MRNVILAVALIAVPLTANAGPFGIDKGEKVEQLGEVESRKDALFALKSPPPKPHTAFDTYLVVATPEAGVCMVKGLSPNITNDAYGQETRAEFDRIKAQLDANYGKSKMADFLRSGSIWNEPREWTMALKQNQRAYEAAWDKASGAKLKDGITQIILYAIGLSQDTTTIAVQYRFDNWDACQAERNKAQGGAL